MSRPAALLLAMALGAMVISTGLPGAAQQPGKPFRIGILSPAGSPSTKAFDALREGLRELGYIDGANITFEYRLAAGDYGRLPAMAADLVRRPVDLIVTDGGIATQAAQLATGAIPIVAPTIGEDPVGAGRAASLAHPGGSVTGFTGFNLAGKRVELLKEAFPAVSRIAALRNPATPMLSLQATEEAAHALGLQLRPIAVATAGEIPAGFEAALGVAPRRSSCYPMECSGMSAGGSSPSRRSTGYRPSTRNGNIPMTAG